MTLSFTAAGELRGEEVCTVVLLPHLTHTHTHTRAKQPKNQGVTLAGQGTGA